MQYLVLSCFFLIAIFSFWKGLNYDRVLMLLVAFLASGFVYFSAVLLLLFIIYYLVIQQKVNLISISLAILICLFIVGSIFLMSSNTLNASETGQIILLIFLFILIARKNIFSYDVLLGIHNGFLIGSVLIALNILFKAFVLKDLRQEEFTYFSISSTFNYSGFYLFFGFIVTPYFGKMKSLFRWLFFILYCVCMYLLASRSSFLLGLVLFFYLNIDLRKFLKAITVASIFSITLWFFLNSSLVDSSNQNDIIYSIVNFDSNKSNTERIKMIEHSFEILEHNPFGYGAGNSSQPLHKAGFYHPHPHNVLANWILEFGYFGIFLTFLLLGYILFEIIRYFKVYGKKHIMAVCIFLLFSSLVDSLQYNILMALTTILALWMIKDFNNPHTSEHV